MKKITTIAAALLLGSFGFAASAQTAIPLQPYSISPDPDKNLGQLGPITMTFVNGLNVEAQKSLAFSWTIGDQEYSAYPNPVEGEKDIPAYAYFSTSTAGNGVTITFDEALLNYFNQTVEEAVIDIVIPQGFISFNSTSGQNVNQAYTLTYTFVNQYITPAAVAWGTFQYPYDNLQIAAWWQKQDEALVLNTGVKQATGDLTAPNGTIVKGLPLDLINLGGGNGYTNTLRLNLSKTYVNVTNNTYVAAPTADELKAGTVKTIIEAYGYGIYTLSIGANQIQTTKQTTNGPRTLTNGPTTVSWDFRAVQQGQTPAQVAIFPTQDSFTTYSRNDVNNNGITLVYQFDGPVKFNPLGENGEDWLFTIATESGTWGYGLGNGSISMQISSVDPSYVVVKLPATQVPVNEEYTVTWNIGALSVNYGTDKVEDWVINAPINYNFTIVNPSTLAAIPEEDCPNEEKYFKPVINGNIGVTPNPYDNVYVISDINNVKFQWLSSIVNGKEQYQDVYLVNPNASATLTVPELLKVYELPFNNTNAGNSYSYNPNKITAKDSKGVVQTVATVANYNYNGNFNLSNYISDDDPAGPYVIYITEGTFVNLEGQLNEGFSIVYNAPTQITNCIITPDPQHLTGGGSAQNVYQSSALEDVKLTFGSPLYSVLSEGITVFNGTISEYNKLTEKQYAEQVLPINPDWVSLVDGNDYIGLNLSKLTNGSWTITVPAGYVLVGSETSNAYNGQIQFTYSVYNGVGVAELTGTIQNGATFTTENAPYQTFVLAWNTPTSLEVVPGAYITVNGEPVYIDNDNLATVALGEEGENEPAPLADEVGDGEIEPEFYNAIVVDGLLDGQEGEVVIVVPAKVVSNGLDFNLPETVTVYVAGIAEIEPVFFTDGATIQAYWSAPVVAVANDAIVNCVAEDGEEYILSYNDVLNENGSVAYVEFNLKSSRLMAGEYTMLLPEGFVTLHPENSAIDLLSAATKYEFTLIVSEDGEYEIVDGHESSAIEAIGSSKVVEGVYNLQGVKMSNDLKSLTPGLYIINGKKVLIRK